MKDNTKMEEILDAAASLFNTHGYLKTSMMDIANAVDLTKGGLYHYVAKKEDTLVMIHNRMAKAFAEEFRKVEQSTDDPQIKLEHWIRAHIHLVKDYQFHINVFFKELDNLRNSEHYNKIVGMRDEIQKMLYSIIIEGRKKKCFREDIHPKILTFLIIGMLNWFYQWYHPEGPRSIEKIIEDVQRLVVAGLVQTNNSDERKKR